MRKKVIISTIIPCFNAEKHVSKCLDSILASGLTDFEIIIIDDASKDKSKKILEKYRKFPQIKTIFLKKNQGPAKARNLGVAKASGKYLLFLDIDTEIESDCLEKVIEKFEKDKEVGALQTKLTKGKSRKIDTAGHFLSYFGFPYEVGVGENENKHNQEKTIFGARSAGMGVRKDLFEKIKGFDEDYLIYGEETDLSWRVWLAGYKIIYLPQAKVHHFQKSSLTKKTEYRIFYEGAKNNLSNILKNAPIKIMIWMLPLHVLGWLLVSLKLTLQRKSELAVWVFKGLGWNLKNLARVLEKRKEISAYIVKNNGAVKIMFGKISLGKLFTKGWRWFQNV